MRLFVFLATVLLTAEPFRRIGVLQKYEENLITLTLRKQNVNNNLVSVDRVYPTLVGHEVVGRIFLREQDIDVPMTEYM